MSDYDCNTCGKKRRPDLSQIREGDKVSFVTATQRGRSIRISTKEGKVLQVLDETLSIESRKKLYRVNKGDATPQGAPSPLTYALCGTCDCQAEG
ncbi:MULTISPECIES: hypothetical protein [Billgrantia]|uniref:Uncharacterized protein n=2 Tax=Billgrantia TaxID=3137761 RepID=A0ABS9APR9_9GAMM|nr:MULTISPECIES: hypothetical protein [Halomonas]MCE8002560.1 hypothetical protein [Halomonas ethanolica]MCE8023646.1 hypothetical protein [Halomonas aerodenitrificans]